MRWQIEGFDGETRTGFLRKEAASKAAIEILLQRLVARHPSDDEVTDATLGSAAHFEVHRDKQQGKPILLLTAGNPHYVAIGLMRPAES